jgi:hypothetical protein
MTIVDARAPNHKTVNLHAETIFKREMRLQYGKG